MVADTLRARHGLHDLRGESEAMETLRQSVVLYARSPATVLIQGETGSGKELVAQAIHRESPRSLGANRPFIAINCGAIAESLLESELFGHEDGAFTGARRGGHAGLFEAANHGTLFLDEIGEMPLPLQTRLLRVLEEREVVRVGGTRPIAINVRIISATHCDLEQRIREGRFRADLFYRLAVLRLHLPALRERASDIPGLAEWSLKNALAALGARPHPNLHAEIARLRAAAAPLRLARQRARTAQPGRAPGAVPGRRTAAGAHARLRAGCGAGVGARRRPGHGFAGAGCRRCDRSASRKAPAPCWRASAGAAMRRASYLGISRTTLWRRLRAG